MPSRLTRISRFVIFFFSLLAFLGFHGSVTTLAQGASHSRPLITQSVDESKLVPLTGNVRPEANTAHDRGIVLHGVPAALDPERTSSALVLAPHSRHPQQRATSLNVGDLHA